MSIISEIQTVITEYFARHSVEIVFREQNREIWTTALDHLSYIPAQYCHAMLDFFHCCQHDKAAWIADVSMVLCDKQQYIYGLWPLTVSLQNHQFMLSSCGQPVFPPLFVETLAVKKQKKLSSQCFEICQQLAHNYQSQQWQSIESFQANRHGLSAWYQVAMNAGGQSRVQHELFVDLSLSIAKIKQHFRKSYRPLINQGMKLWRVAVLENANREVWHKFHALYVRVAGKDVRSERAWELQYQAIVDGQAVLIYLTDREDVMIGAGYFYLSRDECVYAIAAYDRSLFDKPLGHVVQFHLIELMKARGLRWYKIGSLVYPQDLPTEKELSIAHFKQGFATHCFPSFLVTHDSC